MVAHDALEVRAGLPRLSEACCSGFHFEVFQPTNRETHAKSSLKYCILHYLAARKRKVGTENSCVLHMVPLQSGLWQDHAGRGSPGTVKIHKTTQHRFLLPSGLPHECILAWRISQLCPDSQPVHLNHIPQNQNPTRTFQHLHFQGAQEKNAH